MLIVTVISFTNCIPSWYTRIPHYDEKLFALREEVINKGTKEGEFYVFYQELENEPLSSLKIRFHENKERINETDVIYHYNDKNFDIIFDFIGNPFEYYVYIDSGKVNSDIRFIETYILDLEEKTFELDYFDDFDLETIAIYSEIALFLEAHMFIAVDTVDVFLKSNFNISYETFFRLILKGQRNCIDYESMAYYRTYILFVLFLVSVAIFIISIVFFVKNKNLLEEEEEDEEIELKNFVKERRKPQKDWSFSPFLKERILAFIIQIVFFICQLSTFLIWANFIEFWGVHTIPHIDFIIDILLAALPVSNMMVLFMTLNMKVINKVPLIMGIEYIICGLLFSGFECIVIYDFLRMDSFFNDMIVHFFPKNLFFPLGCYAFIYYFLYFTLKVLENNKTKLVLFRLVSVPLIGFIIFSMLFQPLVNLGYLEPNPYLESIITSITIPITIFALGYILLKRLLDLILSYRFGYDEFKKYQ